MTEGLKWRSRFGEEIIFKHRLEVGPGEDWSLIDPLTLESLLGSDDPRLDHLLKALYEKVAGSAPAFLEDRLSVARVVTRGCEAGVLVLRIDPLPPLPPPAALPPPQFPPSPPAPTPTVLHFFAARWVDDEGQAIPGIDLEFDESGNKDELVTAGAGVARIDDSSSTSATVKVMKPASLKKLLKPRWNAPRTPVDLVGKYNATMVSLAGELPVFDLPADVVRLFSVQPYVVRAKLVGSFFDSSKSFLLPTAVDGVRGAVDMYDDMPDVALLVVGHTDTSGAASYNDVLSVERATAIKDYLIGNVDGWTPWYGQPIAAEKRWGSKEDRLMAMAMPDIDSKPIREGALAWYRRTRGLDQASLDDVRAKLVTEYMALEGTSIDSSESITVHGCGENFPLDETGDGVSDPDNRRVEIFFFDKDLGVQPPVPGKNSPPGSTAEPEWVRRAVRTESFPAPDPGMVVRLQVHDDEYDPVGNVPCELVLLSGDVLDVDTDPDGWVEVEVPRAKQRISVKYTASADNDVHSYDVHVIPPDAMEDDRYMNHIHNFGFAPSDDGDETTALLFFQSSCRNVPVTGELDAATKQAVDAILQKTMLDQLEVETEE